MFKTLTLLLFVNYVLGRTINTPGLNIIKEFEGFSALFYEETPGNKIIGYGHSCQTYDCSKIHAPITEQQGDSLLHDDLVQFENCVQNTVSFVNENQFSALVSFAFNQGCQTMQTSTLIVDVKAKNYTAASDEFDLWVHVGGHVVPELVKRREAEKILFLTNVTMFE